MVERAKMKRKLVKMEQPRALVLLVLLGLYIQGKL